MLKIKHLICIALVSFGINSASYIFKKFRAVEAYEIKPDVLMVPTYSTTGEVCRIVFEKRHYSSKASKPIDLDGEMSHEQILEIFDDLVPTQDRGRLSLGNGKIEEFSTRDGPSILTMRVYENVSLEMYGKVTEIGDQKYFGATIRWEKRDCN